MSRHHWFGHYPEQYRSSETTGLRPKDILQLNITKQTFYQGNLFENKQEYKYYKNTNIIQSVCNCQSPGDFLIKLVL